MANLNKIMLIGNITRDIELRYTPKGTAVADIGLAVNRVTKNDDGSKNEETTFVDVTLWGRVAEVAHQYSGKGQPLFVEGRLHMDTWVDKETGGNRSKLKVVGEQIQLLNFKQNQNAEPKQAPQQQPAQHQQAGHPMPQKTQLQDVNTSAQGGGNGDSDDIPFMRHTTIDKY